MSGVKISALPAVSAPLLTDIFPEVQPASAGTTYKCTIQQLLTLLQPNMLLTNAGNPNGAVAGTAYQLLWDTTNSTLWECTTTGSSSTAVWTAIGGSGAFLPLAGGTMSGVINMGSHKITSLSDPTNPQDAVTKNYTDTTFLPLAGGTMAGAINMNSHQITSLTDPTNPQDAATKNYVDAIATGGGAPCYCATTANLTATYNNGTSGIGATLTNSGAQAVFSVDGQTPSVGARVLVKNQSSNTQNGVYTLTNAGSISTNWVLTRATDYDTPANINNTGVIPIENGTVNGNTGWINTTVMVTVGTTAITFVQFGISAPVSLANGGTGASLTASNGGIVYSNASTFAVLSGTSTANQVLLSGSSTTPAWSTATYPTTITSGNLLYGSASNVISGLSNTNSAALTSSSSGIPQWTALTDGQLVIGSSTGAPTAATLTASTGISITNGHNSITIASSGANPWVDETGSSVTMTANTGYTSDDGASLVTFTLPATSAIGDWVEINGKGSGGWTIAQASGQQIHVNGSATTLGATGTLSSTNQYDCVRLRCITANTIWVVASMQSTGLTIV